GYYDQKIGYLDTNSSVFEEADSGNDAKDQQIRDVLGSLLFRGDDVCKPIRLLSGGERARVRLAQLLLERPNVLALDEPTNHLDIASSEALENTLRQFEGTILCVSHDRYFLDKVANRLLVLHPPGLTDFTGTYDQWHEKDLLARQQAAAVKTQARQPASAPRKEPKSAPAKPAAKSTARSAPPK